MTQLDRCPRCQEYWITGHTCPDERHKSGVLESLAESEDRRKEWRRKAERLDAAMRAMLNVFEGATALGAFRQDRVDGVLKMARESLL